MYLPSPSSLSIRPKATPFIRPFHSSQISDLIYHLIILLLALSVKSIAFFYFEPKNKNQKKNANMKTVASIAFLALVAPIFAVPFEQLEARKYYDDNTSTSTVFHTKTSLFAIPTTQVPYTRLIESLSPSDLTIVPSATTTHPYRAPHHTSASEDDDEHKHTRSGYPFHSGSGVAHHTHHTRPSFTVHPTGKRYHTTY